MHLFLLLPASSCLFLPLPAELIFRCDTPLELLRTMRAQLDFNGRLIVAVVLPFRPFVEAGSNRFDFSFIPPSCSIQP